MLTPQQVQEIRQKSGLNPIAVKSNNSNFAGRFSYLKNEKEPSIFDKISDAFSKRFNSIKDTFNKGTEKPVNQSYVENTSQGLEMGLQTAGSMAGFVGDILGIGFNEVTPEPIKKKIEQVATEIVNTPEAKSIMQSYASFKQKHPEAAKDFESAVNILSLLPIGKGASMGAEAATKAAKAGAEAIEAGAKAAIVPTGKAMEKASEVLYKTAIPLSKQEARIVQSYKVKSPLLQRVFEPLSTQPRTKAITALEKGFAGTEEMIGIQAKREAESLWNTKIAPAVESISEKYNIQKAFSEIEKNISSMAEQSRKNDLLEALNAMREDYKGISKVTYKQAQEIKSGLDKFTPEKVFNGKPIGSSFKEIQNMLANDIRKKTYAILSDVNIRTDYLDYGNLKQLAEYGLNAMTSGARKGGFGSFVSNLWDRATTPVFTGAGKVLKKVGQSLNK